jgi:hypothetical protein
MKGVFLSAPDASNALRLVYESIMPASILRIGHRLLLVLCHQSPMKQAPISL